MSSLPLLQDTILQPFEFEIDALFDRSYVSILLVLNRSHSIATMGRRQGQKKAVEGRPQGIVKRIEQRRLTLPPSTVHLAARTHQASGGHRTDGRDGRGADVLDVADANLVSHIKEVGNKAELTQHE